MDILREADITETRRPHRCFGCLKMIPAGAPAHVQVNNDCGKAGSIYTHPYCQEIMQEMWDYNDMSGDDTFEEGGVTQYLSDIGYEGTPEEYTDLGEFEKKRRGKNEL